MEIHPVFATTVLFERFRTPAADAGSKGKRAVFEHSGTLEHRLRKKSDQKDFLREAGGEIKIIFFFAGVRSIIRTPGARTSACHSARITAPRDKDMTVVPQIRKQSCSGNRLIPSRTAASTFKTERFHSGRVCPYPTARSARRIISREQAVSRDSLDFLSEIFPASDFLYSAGERPFGSSWTLI